MRGLAFYIAAITVFLATANASLAAAYIAPVPTGLGGPNSAPAYSETPQPVQAAPIAAPVQAAPAATPVQPLAMEQPAPAPVAAPIRVVPHAAPAAPVTASPRFVVPAPVMRQAEPEPVMQAPVQAIAPQPVAETAPIAASVPVAVQVETPAQPALEQANQYDLISVNNARRRPTPAVIEPAYTSRLTLEQVLLDAYKYNPRIKAERERQKGTDEQVAEAVSGFRPSAVANYERGRARTPSLFGGDDNYGTTINKSLRVEQPIFRGGGTMASYQAAKQRVKAGQFRLKAVEQQVMFETIAAYMDVVQSQSILAIARNNESVLREQLKASQDRFDVGEVTRTDVAQSEARLSNASAQVILAEGDLISAIAELENLIDKKPEAALSTPSRMPVLPASLKESLQIAQGANPDLLQSVHIEKASKYDIRRNVASILPQVSLVGALNRQEGLGAFGPTSNEQDAITLNFTIPLYQSGAEYARIRQAKAVRSQRQFEAMNTRLTVDAVVTQSWEGLETAIATITARRDQIKAAEVALDGVKQEQEYGARTVLDVLDAEQELFIARSNLVRAERDRVVAVFGLLQALGQLTPENLNLGVESYDPKENLDRVKWLPIGF